jgi:hypothetical protein
MVYRYKKWLILPMESCLGITTFSLMVTLLTLQFKPIQTFKIDKLSMSGWASKDNKVLTLGTPGTATPEIAKLTYSSGEPLYQLGHASHVFIWLGPKTGR